jgi:hypothetical protein
MVIQHRHPAMGASPPPSLRLAAGTGLSAPIFWLRYSLRQKYFRFYPFRGATRFTRRPCEFSRSENSWKFGRGVSLPFGGFTFLLRKNAAATPAGIKAGRLYIE